MPTSTVARDELPTSHDPVGRCSPTASTSGRVATGLTISAAQFDDRRTCMLLYGVSGRTPVARRCSTTWIAAPRRRTGAVSSGGTSAQCDRTLTFNWNAFVAANRSSLGMSIVPLIPVQVQVRIRDPTSPAHLVLSNAVEILACP